MKATLEFTLPEDRVAHETAVRAQDWKQLAIDMDDKLRSIGKYNTETWEALDGVAAAAKIREELRNFAADRGLLLDE